MSSVGAKKLTYESWLAMPETKVRYEIVDEILRMPRGPTADHQWICFRLALRLHQHAEERGLGVVMPAPLDLLIQREPLRVRQPDILYRSAEPSGIRRRADIKGIQVLEIAPDLVVEVQSPGNTAGLIKDRLEDYRRIGVVECWLVDPETDTVEVVMLSSDGITTEAIYGAADTLRSVVLDDLELPLRQLFE